MHTLQKPTQMKTNTLVLFPMAGRGIIVRIRDKRNKDQPREKEKMGKQYA